MNSERIYSHRKLFTVTRIMAPDPTQVRHLNQPLLQSLTVLSLVRHMSGTAFGTGLILFYFLSYFFLLLISRGSKNRGSMDPVHERGPWTRSIFSWTRSMDPVHGGGPWTRGPCFVLSRYSGSPCSVYKLYSTFPTGTNYTSHRQKLRVANKCF